MIPAVEVDQLIRANRDRLTPAERRVADVILTDPQAVAFGTVAELATRAATSGATVVRLATKLGLEGFTDLQERVRGAMTRRLRPATERIRLPPQSDLLDRTLALETTNLQQTFERADRAAFDASVNLLASRSRRVFVLASESAAGIGTQLVTELGMLRRNVTQVWGTEVAVYRTLADLSEGDALVALDLARYDRWLLSTAAYASERGARIIALTDSELSPLARVAEFVFPIAVEGPGPFDSHLGAMGLLGAITAAVATKLRVPAADHLDRIESAWADGGVLIDE